MSSEFNVYVGVYFKVPKIEQESIIWYSFADEFDLNVNRFNQIDDTGYWKPNMAPSGTIYSDSGRNSELIIDNKSIDNSIVVFKSINKDIFDKFHQRYGVELEVLFGSFAYYN